MTMMALVLLLAMPAPQSGRPAYQAAVTSTDIQRLQDQVYDTGNEISRLRSRDQSLADRLQPQLDDLRDEVIYLKVKLRKEGSVSRADYNDVRTRIESVRGEARGDAARQGSSTWNGGGYASAPPPSSQQQQPPPPPVYGGTEDQARQVPARRGEVPAGTEVDVRLERQLSSETSQVEDRFTATTVVDLYSGNDILIPAGSTMRGVVSSVTRATRTERKGSLTVAFDQVTIHGRSYPIHATVEQALESEGIKGEAGKIGAGAGVGAIIGGILGGAKGALLGILVGGGGTIAATEGKDVVLPPGTVLRVKFDQSLMVR
jgi:hypothetical protein